MAGKKKFVMVQSGPDTWHKFPEGRRWYIEDGLLAVVNDDGKTLGEFRTWDHVTLSLALQRAK